MPGAPQIGALPVPPTLPALVLPSAASVPSTDAAPSEAQCKLDALISSLVSVKETRPPAVMQALGEHTASRTAQESKLLHQWVNAKTKARKELAKLRTARATYLSAWDGYLAQVFSVLETQFKERDTTLANYQLKEATATLSRLTKDKQEEHVDEDMEDGDGLPDDKISECVQHVQEQARKRREQLQILLKGARDAQKEGLEIKREHSRTPRRAPVDGGSGPVVHNIGDSPLAKPSDQSYDGRWAVRHVRW